MKQFNFLGKDVRSTIKEYGNESVEDQLYTALFSNYKSEIRPVVGTDHLEQIEAFCEFGLVQIGDLDEKSQKFTSHGYLAISWTDQLLQWDPLDYNNASFIIVPAKKVWLPEITAVNSVENADELMSSESGSRVRIFSDGSVNWVPYMRWSTACSIDVSLFPYDIQECTISFANWMYTSLLLKFSVKETVRTESFEINSEWELLNSTSWTEEKTDGTYLFPFIHMKVRIKRNPLYFELNVLLPAILLSFLLIPMFILPVESGEKVSLGVTLMLAYSIFLLMMTDVTPRSGTTPKLTVAILICIIISGVGIFLNIVIINIHSHLPHKPVPQWVKRLILGKLATLLCCMKYKEDEVQPFQVEPMTPKVLTNTNKMASLEKEFGTSDSVAKLIEYQEYFKTIRMEDDQVEKNKEDWNKFARVLDRFFLIIYCTFFTFYLIAVIAIKYDTSSQT